MTLRGRLTTAFLAVVLGPVLIGAFFVGGAVTAVGAERSMERLDRAVTAVGTSVGALCRQLHAAASAVAIVPDPAARAAVAQQVVAGGLGSAVRVAEVSGETTFTTPDAPAQPWADCAGQPGGGAIAARVDLRDPTGAPLGSVTVAESLDAAFVARLSAASGVGVTLLAPAGEVAGEGHRPGGDAVHSTEPADTRDGVVRATAALAGGGTAETGDGRRYARRVALAPGQPLPLVLSVPRRDPQRLYTGLVSGVLLTALVVIAAAWWLARSTTRPLAELAHAADRVAGGDLAARVPVRRPDEVGRLAGTFNRMTREMQAYVHALTASRDQVRGHLAILGDTLSSTHDLGKILQVILQTALAATGARSGVVLLLDPATGTLVGQCAEGLAGRWPGEPAAEAAGTARDGAARDGTARDGTALDGATGDAAAGDAAADDGAAAHGVGLAVDVAAAGGAGDREAVAGERAEDPAALRVPVGSGLLGRVAATGVPLRGHLDRDGPPLSPHEPRCRTYVAVPFSAPGPPGGPIGAGGLAWGGGGPPFGGGPGNPWRTGQPAAPAAALGVLALYDRLGADEFDDTDVSTLRTFAGQAAVAVDNVRMHHEAQRLSLTDPLTGLWNYRYLQESVHREVERASRFRRMLSVLAMDLDRFKEVNDTYGHGAGDAVLSEFARRVRAALREVDLAFRQGGEEFVVLLPETDRAGAIVVAQRLGAAVREAPVALDPVRAGAAPITVPISVSIGIAVYPDHATTAPQVLEAADDALYAAKAAGRDTYRVAAAGVPPAVQELVVLAAAASPEDGLPRAGGASGGPHPPRQSRCR